MYRDPIVEEIHRVRAKIYKECRGDRNKLLARWKRIEKQFRERVVDLSGSLDRVDRSKGPTVPGSAAKRSRTTALRTKKSLSRGPKINFSKIAKP